VPAPAVIPAPIAYIKVVAVKKLVVELQALGHLSPGKGCTDDRELSLDRSHLLLSEWVGAFGPFTLKKLECLKQAHLP
jgi:hypothetical protein